MAILRFGALAVMAFCSILEIGCNINRRVIITFPTSSKAMPILENEFAVYRGVLRARSIKISSRGQSRFDHFDNYP